MTLQKTYTTMATAPPTSYGYTVTQTQSIELDTYLPLIGYYDFPKIVFNGTKTTTLANYATPEVTSLGFKLQAINNPYISEPAYLKGSKCFPTDDLKQTLEVSVLDIVLSDLLRS